MLAYSIFNVFKMLSQLSPSQQRADKRRSHFHAAVICLPKVTQIVHTRLGINIERLSMTRLHFIETLVRGVMFSSFRPWMWYFVISLTYVVNLFCNMYFKGALQHSMQKYFKGALQHLGLHVDGDVQLGRVANHDFETHITICCWDFLSYFSF